MGGGTPGLLAEGRASHEEQASEQLPLCISSCPQVPALSSTLTSFHDEPPESCEEWNEPFSPPGCFRSWSSYDSRRNPGAHLLALCVLDTKPPSEFISHFNVSEIRLNLGLLYHGIAYMQI